MKSGDFKAVAADQKNIVTSWMYRQVLEKKPCVICISKDHESVSHLSPSFHVLAPTDLGMSLRG